MKLRKVGWILWNSLRNFFFNKKKICIRFGNRLGCRKSSTFLYWHCWCKFVFKLFKCDSTSVVYFTLSLFGNRCKICFESYTTECCYLVLIPTWRMLKKFMKWKLLLPKLEKKQTIYFLTQAQLNTRSLWTGKSIVKICWRLKSLQYYN